MTTRLDEHRLSKGETASNSRSPTTLQEAREYLDMLNEAIRAMQSLDDLGSPEENQAAWDRMIALQKRYSAVAKEWGLS